MNSCGAYIRLKGTWNLSFLFPSKRPSRNHRVPCFYLEMFCTDVCFFSYLNNWKFLVSLSSWSCFRFSSKEVAICGNGVCRVSNWMAVSNCLRYFGDSRRYDWIRSVRVNCDGKMQMEEKVLQKVSSECEQSWNQTNSSGVEWEQH